MQYLLQRSIDLLFQEEIGALFKGSGDPARFLFYTRITETTFHRLEPG